MFSPAKPAQVYIATGVTDMRKSINGLSILVAYQLELDPLSGHLFAFCNRKRDMVKILYWDRNGFCLYAEFSIKTESAFFPVKDFDDITSSITKSKVAAGKEIERKLHLNKQRQSIY